MLGPLHKRQARLRAVGPAEYVRAIGVSGEFRSEQSTRFRAIAKESWLKEIRLYVHASARRLWIKYRPAIAPGWNR